MLSFFRKKNANKTYRIRLKRGCSYQLDRSNFVDGEIGVVKDTKQLVVCINGDLYQVGLTKLDALEWL